MTSYRDAALVLWGEAGAYAHDMYARLRSEFYPEVPCQLPIVIGLTAYGHCVGLTRPGWEHGPRISVFSSLFHHGRHQVDDLLTHELLHVWLSVKGLDPEHDGQSWYGAINRLSPAVLGREIGARRGADRKSVRVPNPDYADGNGEPRTVVRKVRVADAVQHADVAGWPQAFRPADYDWGKPMRCPSY